MNMTETAAPAAAGPVTSAGTVTYREPAMTVQVTAENPVILQGVAVGDQVSFELKSATETSIVTMLQSAKRRGAVAAAVRAAVVPRNTGGDARHGKSV